MSDGYRTIEHDSGKPWTQRFAWKPVQIGPYCHWLKYYYVRVASLGVPGCAWIERRLRTEDKIYEHLVTIYD